MEMVHKVVSRHRRDCFASLAMTSLRGAERRSNLVMHHDFREVILRCSGSGRWRASSSCPSAVPSAERRAELDRMPAVDIALVDEAHYSRRKNPTAGSQAPPEYGYLYLAIQEALRLKARSLWLATATPMQLDAVEAADLLALTRRVGAFQYDARLMQVYYETLSGLTSNRSLRTPEWTFLRRAVLAVEAEDPCFWAFLRQTVIDDRTRLAVRQWLD
jgi:hypothetical protein